MSLKVHSPPAGRQRYSGQQGDSDTVVNRDGNQEESTDFFADSRREIDAISAAATSQRSSGEDADRDDGQTANTHRRNCAPTEEVG